ncbi:MAG: conjugal transfer protein TraI [Alphaproteobacteria bacterium]|nr:conjugal transfer protein TraI [Alphaproteobacteria bacterium]
MNEETETAREPKAEPEDLALRARPRPVTRINRRVLVGVIGLGCLLLAGLVIVALDPPTWKPKDARPELVTGTRKPTADGLDRLPSSYEGVPTPVVRPSAPVLTTVPQLQSPDPAVEAERAEKARLMRLEIEARASQPFFRLQTRTAPPPSAAAGTLSAATPPASATDLAALTSAATERLRAQIDGAVPTVDATDQNRKLAFLRVGPDKEIYNPHGTQKPVSPYQLLAGAIIPASLVTGLNADLPGFVIAQVTEHVYDTVTGRHLLVPQGSRLIGRYDSVVAYGQERALVVWQRIIRPDGTSIVIDNLPATDAAGYAGLTDAVDLKTWRLLKGIGLATVLGVGSSLAFGQSSGDSDIIRALRESTGQTTNRAGQRLIERELNVQPTLTVRPGWPLRVIVHKDIILTPVSP